MLKYRSHVEDYQNTIKKWYLENNMAEKNKENLEWEIDVLRKTMEVMHDYIGYCIVDILVMQKTNLIPKENIKICEIDTETNSIVFLDLEQAKQRMKRVNYYLDDTIISQNTSYKNFFYTLWDETKTKVLSEKIHISNMTAMMDMDEEQEFTDGREFYLFPERLVEEYTNKKMLYANKFSDPKYLYLDKYY